MTATANKPAATATTPAQHEPAPQAAAGTRPGPVPGRHESRVALTITGTQPAGWVPLTDVLAQAFGTAAALRVTRDLGMLESLPADERCILFIESPVRALSRWVAESDGQSARATLEAWSDSARQLLRHAQRAPSGCLVVDASEAFADPSALVQSVTRWCAWPTSGSTLPAAAVAPEPDTLCATLAAHLCTQDPASLKLFDELHASSVVLEGAASIDPASPGLGDGAAILRYRALVAHEQDLAQRSRQLAALEADLQAARDKFAAQVAETSAIKSAKARSDTAAACSTADADFLLSRTLELHTMLEAEHGRAERQVSLATTAATESSALRALLAQRESEAQSLLSKHAEAEALATRRGRELADIQRALDHTRRTNAEREQQVARQLREQEHAIEWHTGARRRTAMSTPSLRQRQVHDEPPHRHLHFALDALEIEGRGTPATEVRLLDHCGHPGLAIFALGKETFISAWQPHGQENGRSFMLFVPNDEAGTQALLRLGSSDWSRLRHLAVLISCHLQHSGAPTGWCHTAQRLVVQLQGLPARLRYDEVRVARATDDPQSIHISFEDCTHGNRVLGKVRLQWDPQQGRLCWRRGGAAPLVSWPVGADGLLADQFTLPVDDTTAWRACPMADRELMLALLDAMPGAVAQAPDSAATAGFSQARLAAAAAQLHRRARRVEQVRTWRSLLRRLLRRRPQHRQ